MRYRDTHLVVIFKLRVLVQQLWALVTKGTAPPPRMPCVEADQGVCQYVGVLLLTPIEHMRRDLMSYTEYFNFVHHFDLLDATFTRREAAVCFVRSRMAVVNELKSRTKLMQLSFVDFLEVLVRIAGAKALPTDDLLHSAYTSAAGSLSLIHI